LWTGGDEHWDGEAQPHKCHSERDLEPGCFEVIYTINELLQGVVEWHQKSEKCRLNTWGKTHDNEKMQ